MRGYIRSFKFISSGVNYLSFLHKSCNRRYYNGVTFIDFYKNTTGNPISKENFHILKTKHPNIEGLTYDRLQCILQILEKFGITATEACHNLHIFSMNPITMDNYGEILKECGFINVAPQYIIKYHTLVRSRTIANLKKEGLLRTDLVLENELLDKFEEWPTSLKILQTFHDSNTSILTIRMSVLERYLNWKLSVTSDEFQKYCKHYLPMKHKPMADIQEAINLAQNELKFDRDVIKRNGFIISADPLHTKLILENVGTLSGLDIRDAIRSEPALMKNNYNSLLQIRDILEEYRIPLEAQKRCLKVYCMRPETVRERLEELSGLKEYQVLSTNPRVLNLVVHKKKMMNRLTKIEAAKKQCYSLNHLVSSSKMFNIYINNFGDKVCGRDIAILISSSLSHAEQSYTLEHVLSRLRRHKYYLHAALGVIDTNIQFLKNNFEYRIIFENCQLLLYPISEVQHYINFLLKLRNGETKATAQDELQYNNLNRDILTDSQILSLVLYEIEKKYHFSGDGIWTRHDGIKQSVN